VERWSRLYAKPEQVDAVRVDVWRERLSSLSWFMRCLNEPMARTANKEDRCKGRFWEGRFRSQALLDESALLRCMAYVDLNPIRASIAETPETSGHTSIKARIDGCDRHLLPFPGEGHNQDVVLPIGRHDYLQLVDWTGRQMSPSRRGRIPEFAPPILERLDMDGRDWLREMKYYGRWYYRAVGSLHAMQRYGDYLGQHLLKGLPKASGNIA